MRVFGTSHKVQSHGEEQNRAKETARFRGARVSMIDSQVNITTSHLSRTAPPT